MSEGTKDDVKITTVEKVKDPKKVEAGKKLAAISKQAKEKKAIEASNREERVKQAKNSESEFCLSNIDPLTAVGVVGVFGLVMYNGYTNLFKKSFERSEDQPSTLETAKTEETVKTTKPKRVYRELDTLG